MGGVLILFSNLCPHLSKYRVPCPKCSELMQLRASSSVQFLGDATTGYNNYFSCESCDVQITASYNGGWGSNYIVICKKGESYYGEGEHKTSFDWHSNNSPPPSDLSIINAVRKAAGLHPE